MLFSWSWSEGWGLVPRNPHIFPSFLRVFFPQSWHKFSLPKNCLFLEEPREKNLEKHLNKLFKVPAQPYYFFGRIPDNFIMNVVQGSFLKKHFGKLAFFGVYFNRFSFFSFTVSNRLFERFLIGENIKVFFIFVLHFILLLFILCFEKFFILN
jgi:hypothetical protein